MSCKHPEIFSAPFMPSNNLYFPSRVKTPFIALGGSFWPLILSLRLLMLALNLVLWFHLKVSVFIVVFSLTLVSSLIFVWWRDVIRESLLGLHTRKLEVRMRSGFLLFILSEVFFFVSFFWAFYDASLSPSVELGIVWPPLGILPLEVYSIPLFTTVILLSSGVSVTWAHHSLINNFFIDSILALGFTVLLGVYFLAIQYVEYSERAFSLADGIYGTTFFLCTGFHGFHVIVGTLYLSYVFILISRGILLYNHHFSFEAAAWYWHFVDVVWLFLYLSIYWWGSL